MWFTRKTQRAAEEQQDKTVAQIDEHKVAKEEVIDQARKANRNLNRVLVENGFTVKIWVATGGHAKKGVTR